MQLLKLISNILTLQYKPQNNIFALTAFIHANIQI